jgi:hypothetical protein
MAELSLAKIVICSLGSFVNPKRLGECHLKTRFFVSFRPDHLGIAKYTKKTPAHVKVWVCGARRRTSFFFDTLPGLLEKLSVNLSNARAGGRTGH